MTSAELRSIHFGLLDHIARHVGQLLPQRLAMVATPEQLLLVSTTSGAERTIATQSVHAPQRLDTGNIEALAHHVLADAQDLVIEHLHEPWPALSDGRALHAFAAVSGSSVRLGFSASAADEPAITLPDFVLPEGSGLARSAG